ncbi:MAG: T9SS type A sorting domain-containing protein [Dysgonamonadaceae bacterium]|jgi:hypothetical protein|nr:T9SS type A sorting domain-containing protein [Dysgonamonadaceae bacterium]
MTRKTLFLTVILAIFSLNIKAWDNVLTARRLAVSSQGGQKQFYVKSKVPWTLTTPNNWVSIKPSSGNGSTSWGDRDGGELVTVTVWPSDVIDPQTGDAVERQERRGVVTLKYGTTTNYLPVYQLNHDSCYHNGEVILVKEHNPDGMLPGTKPIPIMLFGDGWDLMDLYKSYHEDDGRGFFPAYAAAWAKRCSEVDMMSDFADYFDIYAYSGESMQRGTHGLSKYRQDPHNSRQMDMAVSDANATIRNHVNYNNAIFVDLSNDTPGGWNFYAGGRQYAAYGNPANRQTGLGWWGHEFTGHDVSNMPDFYVMDGSRSLCWPTGYYPGQPSAADNCTEVTHYTMPEDLNNTTLTQFTKFPDAPFFREGDYPTYYKSNAGATGLHAVFRLYGEWDSGYYWNVDYEKDPAKVVWKDFIGKTGYSNVGIKTDQRYSNTSYYYRPESINEMIREGVGWDLGLRIWIWNKLLERAGIGNPHILSANDPSHPRSIENFMIWDEEHGYANNKTGWRNQPAVPQLLTEAYYTGHNLQLLAPFTFAPVASDSTQATPPQYPEGFINLTTTEEGDAGTGWECKTAPHYDKGTNPNVIVIDAPGEYKFVGSTSLNNISVSENVKDVIIELRNATIDVANYSKSAIQILGGAEATIKLYGDNYLGGGPNTCGISVPHKGGSGGLGVGGKGGVPSNASVIITSAAGDGSTEGYVKVTAGTFAAGIGGSNQLHTTSGNITINGGTIEAYGGGESPAIGGRVVSATITSQTTINGGKVTAIAGGGAGIGAGVNGNNYGTIDITGGSIYASGTNRAAIGGGSGKLNITGGTIVARNTVNSDGTSQPGIGGATEINISNTSIIATGISSKATISNSVVLTSNTTGAITEGENTLIIKDAAIDMKLQSVKTGATGESQLSTNLLLTGNTTIPAANTLIIPEGENLVINEGVTLTVEGNIIVRGGLTCNNGNIIGTGIRTEGNGYFSLCNSSEIKNAADEISGVNVFATDGGIIASLAGPAKISVYSLPGQQVASLQGTAGENRIDLEKGLYIVKVEAKGYKVLVK